MNENPVDPRHLQTLYEITRYLNSSLDLAEVLDYVIDRVIDVTGAERGFLMLKDEASGELRFQVARGIDQQDINAPQFEVSTSIIREVMQNQTPLLTSNAQFDQRFAEKTSVIVKGLRSIMCVPIMVRDELLGVVYVDNRLQDGIFNSSHRDLLAAFASQSGVAIENARLYQVAVEKGRIQRELEMARTIQQGLLPTLVEVIPGYDVAFAWRSAREVAGDFYDCFLLNDRQMGVVVADVSDKGVPAAIFMAVARSLLRGNALAAQAPDEALALTNHLLIKDAVGGIFVTIYYTVFEIGGRTQCVNAGHNLPLWYRADTRTIELLPRGGRPLGWFEELPLAVHEYQLTPGDVMLFYTDGLTELESAEGVPFGEQRLIDLLYENAEEPADRINKAILNAVSQFSADVPAFDDLTLFIVRYTG